MLYNGRSVGICNNDVLLILRNRDTSEIEIVVPHNILPLLSNGGSLLQFYKYDVNENCYLVNTDDGNGDGFYFLSVFHRICVCVVCFSAIGKMQTATYVLFADMDKDTIQRFVNTFPKLFAGVCGFVDSTHFQVKYRFTTERCDAFKFSHSWLKQDKTHFNFIEFSYRGDQQSLYMIKPTPAPRECYKLVVLGPGNSPAIAPINHARNVKQNKYLTNEGHIKDYVNGNRELGEPIMISYLKINVKNGLSFFEICKKEDLKKSWHFQKRYSGIVAEFDTVYKEAVKKLVISKPVVQPSVSSAPPTQPSSGYQQSPFGQGQSSIVGSSAPGQQQSPLFNQQSSTFGLSSVQSPFGQGQSSFSGSSAPGQHQGQLFSQQSSFPVSSSVQPQFSQVQPSLFPNLSSVQQQSGQGQQASAPGLASLFGQQASALGLQPINMSSVQPQFSQVQPSLFPNLSSVQQQSGQGQQASAHGVASLFGQQSSFPVSSSAQTPFNEGQSSFSAQPLFSQQSSTSEQQLQSPNYGQSQGFVPPNIINQQTPPLPQSSVSPADNQTSMEFASKIISETNIDKKIEMLAAGLLYLNKITNIQTITAFVNGLIVLLNTVFMNIIGGTVTQQDLAHAMAFKQPMV